MDVAQLHVNVVERSISAVNKLSTSALAEPYAFNTGARPAWTYPVDGDDSVYEIPQSSSFSPLSGAHMRAGLDMGAA